MFTHRCSKSCFSFHHFTSKLFLAELKMGKSPKIDFLATWLECVALVETCYFDVNNLLIFVTVKCPAAQSHLNHFNKTHLCDSFQKTGLRSRRKNNSAPTPELFFSWTWLRLQLRSSRFSWVSPAPEFSFFMAPVPYRTSVRFHTLNIAYTK